MTTVWLEEQAGSATVTGHSVFGSHILPLSSVPWDEPPAGPATYAECPAGPATHTECVAGPAAWAEEGTP